MSRSQDAIKQVNARFFDAEALGTSLRELGVDVIAGEETDFTSRWFQTAEASKMDADLVIWSDGKKRIIKHQLCFFGQVVEWNPIHGTRTGFVLEEETSDQEASEIIRYDSRAQINVVNQAVQIVSRIPDLSEKDRADLIFHLRESPKLHKNALKRALKVWAPAIDQINSCERPTFWKRLRNWVLGE
jgi:hypothetical protein